MPHLIDKETGLCVVCQRQDITAIKEGIKYKRRNYDLRKVAIEASLQQETKVESSKKRDLLDRHYIKVDTDGSTKLKSFVNSNILNNKEKQQVKHDINTPQVNRINISRMILRKELGEGDRGVLITNKLPIKGKLINDTEDDSDFYYDDHNHDDKYEDNLTDGHNTRASSRLTTNNDTFRSRSQNTFRDKIRKANIAHASKNIIIEQHQPDSHHNNHKTPLSNKNTPRKPNDKKQLPELNENSQEQNIQVPVLNLSENQENDPKNTEEQKSNVQEIIVKNDNINEHPKSIITQPIINILPLEPKILINDNTKFIEQQEQKQSYPFIRPAASYRLIRPQVFPARTNNLANQRIIYTEPIDRASGRRVQLMPQQQADETNSSSPSILQPQPPPIPQRVYPKNFNKKSPIKYSNKKLVSPAELSVNTNKSSTQDEDQNKKIHLNGFYPYYDSENGIMLLQCSTCLIGSCRNCNKRFLCFENFISCPIYCWLFVILPFFIIIFIAILICALYAAKVF